MRERVHKKRIYPKRSREVSKTECEKGTVQIAIASGGLAGWCPLAARDRPGTNRRRKGRTTTEDR